MHCIEFSKSRLTVGIVMIVTLNKLGFKSRPSSMLDQMRDTMLKQRLYFFLKQQFHPWVAARTRTINLLNVPNSFFYTLNIVVKPDMKCKQGNSLNFRVKGDNFLQNTPKVNDKLIILDIIFNAIVRKCFECDLVNDVVRNLLNTS